MISEEKWKELIKKWKTVGPVYQIPRRSHDRLKHFCDHCVPLLKGKNVLEIGANAGVFGYCIAEVSKNYIGVEPANKISDKKRNKTDYFKQAQITEKEQSNMMFVNMTVKEAFGGGADMIYNTLVMCYTLYHLSNKEIDLLKEKILPHCDLVIIQNREQKRKTKHNSYKFWKSKKVVKFFQDQGYDVELIWGEDRGVKKAFSEIICRSPNELCQKDLIKDIVKSSETNRGKLLDIDTAKSKEWRGPAIRGKTKDLTIIDQQDGLLPPSAKKKAVKKKVAKKSAKKVSKKVVKKTIKKGEKHDTTIFR